METLSFNTKEAARYLGVKDQTLRAWRCNGAVKIPFIKLGKAVIYRVADLDAFIERNRVAG